MLNRLYYADYANRLVVEGSSSALALRRIDPNGFNLLIANTTEIGKYATGKGVDNVRQNLNGMTFKPQAPANGKAWINPWAGKHARWPTPWSSNCARGGTGGSIVRHLA